MHSRNKDFKAKYRWLKDNNVLYVVLGSLASADAEPMDIAQCLNAISFLDGIYEYADDGDKKLIQDIKDLLEKQYGIDTNKERKKNERKEKKKESNIKKEVEKRKKK